MSALTIEGLRARTGDLEILRGVDLTVPFGELHALMGPNGSGKSTLCHALMGRPGYEALGSARLAGVELLGLDVDDRARAGLFETFQYPVEIPGVSLRELIEEMDAAGEGVAARAAEAAVRFGMDPFLDRPVNVGLSGGEKKRSEIFQLVARSPRMAILDEIDSGLDVDAVREVANAVEAMRRPDLGVLLITHYSRILKFLDVDRVHVLLGGRIVLSGGPEVADRLEAEGYDGLRRSLGIEPPGGDADPFP